MATVRDNDPYDLEGKVGLDYEQRLASCSRHGQATGIEETDDLTSRTALRILSLRAPYSIGYEDRTS
jgi:hypothetical protein